MDSLEQKLTQILYRHDCPDPLTLGEYHLALLDPAEKRAMQEHVGLCPHCRREVAQLAGFLAATAPAPAAEPAPTLLEKVKVFLVDLLAPDDSAAGAPVLAWRDQENGLQEQTEFRVRRVGDFLVSLTLQPRPEGEGRTILGDIAHVQQKGFPFTDWTLHFWQAGRLRVVTPLEQTGTFSLEADEPAPFELILTGPEIEIHLRHPGYG